MRGDTGLCGACSKRIYATGRAARKVAKQIPGQHMSAYVCAAGHWHLGHLPRSVVHGERSKAGYVAHVQRRRSA